MAVAYPRLDDAATEAGATGALVMETVVILVGASVPSLVAGDLVPLGEGQRVGPL